MAPGFRLWSQLLRPFGPRSVAVRGHAWFPPSPLKFRASGFPTTRLQVTSPPAACPSRRLRLVVTAGLPLCVGLRVRHCTPSWSTGQMRPHVPRRHLSLHRVTGTASSSPVSEALCPRRCPPPYLGSPTGPSLCRGCSVHGVLGTTARSARLAPTNRLRVLAYTVRPAVRGRSRRGPSPSRLCVVCLPLVPLPIRRRDSPTSLARLSVGGNSLRPRGPGSAPSCSPALTSARGTHYVAAAFA